MDRVEELINKLDLEKSAKINDVLITVDGELIAPESYRMKTDVYELKIEHNASSIVFVPEEVFEELKEYVLTYQMPRVEVVEDEEVSEAGELDDTEVARQLEVILFAAAKRGASDIHIIPKENETRIEFRVNGVLELFKVYPKRYATYIVNKIKMLARMDVSNSLVPQDGKMKVKVGDDVFEYRVSTVPTVFGEDAVLRVQRTRSVYSMKLEDIGFEEKDYQVYRERFHYPSGMIIDVGGTGEGKTTTLYLTLMKLFEEYGTRKRILTVEDPVEIYFPQAVQVEVNEKQGRTFGRVLRNFLRQDPDIILVGEIRDEETAQIAVRAALTGHLVLTTLHATDSFNAITRLKDLGLSGVMLASTINVILSQRLVRVLCPNCKKRVKMPGQLIDKYNLDFDEAYMPVGCDKCHGTGFVGRTAVIEVLPLDAEMKEMIARDVPEVSLKKYAREKGFRNLWHNALLKVKRGITSLEEVETKIKPDPILNDTSSVSRAEVDLGIVLYPTKKLVVSVNGKKGYLYDVSGKGISILFNEPYFLEINKPIKAKVETDQFQEEFVFIPKSYKKRAGSGDFLVGGLYRGNLKRLISD